VKRARPHELEEPVPHAPHESDQDVDAHRAVDLVTGHLIGPEHVVEDEKNRIDVKDDRSDERGTARRRSLYEDERPARGDRRHGEEECRGELAAVAACGVRTRKPDGRRDDHEHAAPDKPLV